MKRVGHRRVNPSEYLSPIANPTSKRPATNNIIHAITHSPSCDVPARYIFAQQLLYNTTVIMTTMPRAVDHEERREEIADAVWRVIEREGLEGANLRDIAREAGHTTGGISHYFRDKRELLTFAFGLLVDRSTARMARASAEAGLTEALAQVLPLDKERRRETAVWLALVGASLTDPQLAEG